MGAANAMIERVQHGAAVVQHGWSAPILEIVGRRGGPGGGQNRARLCPRTPRAQLPPKILPSEFADGLVWRCSINRLRPKFLTLEIR